MIEGPGFDAVHEFVRLAAGRDKVEEAAGHQRPIGEVKDPPGQKIASPKIVQQPGVELKFIERRLDCQKIEHRRSHYRVVVEDSTLHLGHIEAQKSTLLLDSCSPI